VGFITDIKTADRDSTGTEAAWTVLGHARDAADARMLLEILGLEQTEWGWTTGRCAWLALSRARHGQEFSANTLRAVLPYRETWRIPAVIKALAVMGLAEPTGQVVKAAHKAAKGRPVRCYRLTPAGEELATETSAPGGEPFLVALNTMEVRPPKVA
jgi:hypothetical protein